MAWYARASASESESAAAVTPRTRPPAVRICPSLSAVPAWKTCTPGTWGRGSEAADGQAGFVAARIAAGAGHHARRRAGRPAQRRLGQAAVDARVKYVQKIAIKANQDGLGFRIAETRVEFEHLRPARRHHESAIQHAGEGRTFFGHACDRGFGNVMQNPLRHGGIEKRISGVDAHAAGVGAGVALADALVILRRQRAASRACRR